MTAVEPQASKSLDSYDDDGPVSANQARDGKHPRRAAHRAGCRRIRPRGWALRIAPDTAEFECPAPQPATVTIPMRKRAGRIHIVSLPGLRVFKVYG